MCVHACVWFFRLAYPIPPGSLSSLGGGTHTFTGPQVPWGLSLCGGARRLYPQPKHTAQLHSNQKLENKWICLKN